MSEEEKMTAVERAQLPPVLTVDQVARAFGVRPKQVLRWVRAGKLEGHKVGRFWRFPRSAVETSEPPAN